jgi:hypothetical protein
MSAPPKGPDLGRPGLHRWMGRWTGRAIADLAGDAGYRLSLAGN